MIENINGFEIQLYADRGGRTIDLDALYPETTFSLDKPARTCGWRIDNQATTGDWNTLWQCCCQAYEEAEEHRQVDATQVGLAYMAVWMAEHL